MNLKEAFRYQNFLQSIMGEAANSLLNSGHCLKTTETHFRKASNPDAEDIVKTSECEDFRPNDDVISLMCALTDERQKLTEAINKAKASLDFDLDAAVETNKFRQHISNTIKSMMRYTPSKRTIIGRDYKFNAEGNQTEYRYNVELVTEDAYNREEAKQIMKKMIVDADKVSSDIDAAMVNTKVDYVPPFDVNETFDDVARYFEKFDEE